MDNNNNNNIGIMDNKIIVRVIIKKVFKPCKNITRELY